MKKYLGFTFIICLLFLVACSSKKEEEVPEVQAEEQKEEVLRSLNEEVLLILGEDYYKKPELLKCLEKEYNAPSIKEKVHILSYEELMVKDFLRLKLIEEKIDELKPSVLISLGLPERSGKYLLKATSEYPEMVVITAFAMEEIAKLEAASDIVLDFTLPDELLNPENDFYVSDEELSLVLLSSLLSAESIRAHGKKSAVLPIEDAKEAFKKAGEMLEDSLGQNEYTLKPYIDTDIGMASYNYIMIQKNVTEGNKQYKESTMKKEHFISSIGYDGMTAVVDRQRYKERKNKTLKDLLQEGDYRAAAAVAIYDGSDSEMEEVISAYNAASSSNYSKEVLPRLFGVAKVDVKKVSML